MVQRPSTPTVRDSMRTSTGATIANMLKAACGPGCLSLAFGCSRTGLYTAPGVLLLLQCCCVYCMFLLTKLKAKLAPQGARSYGDIAALLLGPRWRRVIELVIAWQQLSICCVYFGFVGTNIEAILVSLHVVQSSARLRTILIMVLAYFVLAPLGQIRHWKRLAPLAVLANVCIVLGIALALALPIYKLASDGLFRPLPLGPTVGWRGVPLLFGSTVYSFELVCCVLPIENSMRRPQDVGTVLGVSMGIYCVLMQLAGLLPLLALGTISKGSLTAELGDRFTSDGDIPLIVSMNALVTLAVVLTYPIQRMLKAELTLRALCTSPHIAPAHTHSVPSHLDSSRCPR